MTPYPLPSEVLDQRTRELALPSTIPGPKTGEVVVAVDRAVRVALPLAELAGICLMTPIARIPGAAPHILGLMLAMERRWLTVDVGALLGHAPPRQRDGAGHALLLRHGPVALAVERAESIQCPPMMLPSTNLYLVQGVAADGLLMLNAAAVLAAVCKGVP
jgi:chemotaxis signal transduction protein